MPGQTGSDFESTDMPYQAADGRWYASQEEADTATQDYLGTGSGGNNGGGGNSSTPPLYGAPVDGNSNIFHNGTGGYMDGNGVAVNPDGSPISGGNGGGTGGGAGGVGGDGGNGSPAGGGTPSTNTQSWTQDLVNQFNNAFGTNKTLAQLLGSGLAAASFISSMTQSPYKSKTPAELLAGQVTGNTPTLTPAQVAAAQVPMKAGDQLSRIAAADMPTPIVAGQGVTAQHPINYTKPSGLVDPSQVATQVGDLAKPPVAGPADHSLDPTYGGNTSPLQTHNPDPVYGGAAAAIVPPDMQAAWNNFFNTSAPGKAIDWANGKLTNNGNGTATFTDQFGTQTLNASHPDFSQLAKGDTGIASQWANQYGYDPYTGKEAGGTDNSAKATMPAAPAIPTSGVAGPLTTQSYSAPDLPLQVSSPTAGSAPAPTTGPLSQPVVTNPVEYKAAVGSGQYTDTNAGKAATQSSLVPTQMANDWKNYWDTSKAGDPAVAWGGGTLQRNADGTASYSADGAMNGGSKINSTDTMASLASYNPGIAKQWQDQYGYTTPTSGLNSQWADSKASLPVMGNDTASNQAYWAAHPAELSSWQSAHGITPQKFKKGGKVSGPLTMAADEPSGNLVQGEGGGQDDKVHAKLSPGEYVMDADVVSSLGDGDNATGARKLDEMRHAIRTQKRAAPAHSIPTKAKGPLSYIKG